MTYQEFLQTKETKFLPSGFKTKNLNTMLFDFQAYVIEKALHYGRYGIFSDTGTGKTAMELEIANQIVKHENKPVLILAPLGVVGQHIKQGEKFGIEIKRFSGKYEPCIYITNYEQLHNVDVYKFIGVIIDEASILKNFAGKYRNFIIDSFKQTKYKFPFTATPSPNDVTEIANYCEFLNVKRRTEVQAEYFVHDGGDTQKYRLKGHAIEEFYKFLNKWSIMFMKPDDIGFLQHGYDLPELIINEIEVKSKVVTPGMLWNYKPVSATNINQELRNTLNERLEEVAEIVNNSNDNFIVWCNLNTESELLSKMISDSMEVTGSDKPEYKEEMLSSFGENKFRVLVTKPDIASFGLNYQNCGNQIFSGKKFSFEEEYQCIRRSWRYGRKDPVNIYVVKTDTMGNVHQIINQKRAQFEEMRNLMIKYHERN